MSGMTDAALGHMRLPVICAPMFLVSGPELVIAACKSGIGGAFPSTNVRTIEDLECWMGQVTEALKPDDGPWILNLVTHSSRRTQLIDELKLVSEYKPPVVITALGSPQPVIETVKSYGGLVFADVIDLRLARKAASLGVDGLACITAGAGGHTGSLNPFAFIAAIREFYKGIVVVGGGISDGAGIAGAIAAGADYIYMGTRFLSSIESTAQQEYKDMVISCDASDLVVTDVVTGAFANWLRPSLAAAGIDPSISQETIQRDFSGDVVTRWRDIWTAGQGLGRISKIEHVSEIVDNLESEFSAATNRFVSLARRGNKHDA